VLITRAPVMGAVRHIDVVQAAGAEPSSLVQMPEVAIADYRDLQVSYIQRGPERYTLSVNQPGGPDLGRPLVRAAKAAFHHAITEQPRNTPAVAVGANFVRHGTVSDGTAGRHLLDLLGPAEARLHSAVGKPLLGTGLKLFYDDPPWRVTLTLEPAADIQSLLVASANYHLDAPDFSNLDTELDRLLGMTPRLYASFANVVTTLLGENTRVSVT
jgi:hypothetical protein